MASAAEQLLANLRFDTFRKARDLHARIGFTVLAMILYRIGCYIPIPGINISAFDQAFQGQAKGILGMVNMFSGGAVQRMAVFALGVMPYISASIIVQLLGTVYPPWEKLRKDGGEAGRKTLNQYTRYLTVALGLFQAFGIAMGLQAGDGIVGHPGGVFLITTTVILTAGTMFLTWLGEQITSRGIGNGLSLIIFAGIVAVLPRGVWQMLTLVRTGALPSAAVSAIAALAVVVVTVIVFMERAQRRLLTQYPRRQQGNRMFGGEASFLPLKVNSSGVMAPIFASSLLLLPATAMGFISTAKLPAWAQWLPDAMAALQHGQPLFVVLYGVLIVFFCFFYTSVMFNPVEVAENLRKFGGFLPGLRPGKRTAEYLDFVLTRVTVVGAVYITAVCLLPELLIGYFNVPFYLGGTSILIVVSVTMDTVTQLQSHMVAHQYEGLIRKAKLHTRRAPAATAPAE